MLKPNMLLNILSPETISQLGINSIDNIKKIGQQTKYKTLLACDNVYSVNNDLEYEIKRVKELSNSSFTKDLTSTEKTLFCSMIKFENDEKILSLINQLEISIDDINEMNKLINQYQIDNINYSMAKVKLEVRHGLKEEQAANILQLKILLLNNNYQLNSEDKALYFKAQKILLLLKKTATQRDKSLRAINENITVQKILLLAKHYFGIREDNAFILINKLNELVITCPEKFVNNKKKSL